MENKQIIEGNKLIAEFMNWPLNGPLVPLKLSNSSWGWIMEVVEKIESLDCIDDFRIEIAQVILKAWSKNSEFKYLGYYSNNGKFKDTLNGCTTKIEAIYKVVIEFITWYNSQNK